MTNCITAACIISFRYDMEAEDHLLIAQTLRDELAGFNFDWDVEVFHNEIAPSIPRYLPKSDEIQLQRGWFGHYPVTLDENPILGRHTEYANLYMATGFNSHGLMLPPATGRMLADMIRPGHSETLNAHLYRLE